MQGRVKVERCEYHEEEHEKVAKLRDRIADRHGGRDYLVALRVLEPATGRQPLGHLDDEGDGGDW